MKLILLAGCHPLRLRMPVFLARPRAMRHIISVPDIAYTDSPDSPRDFPQRTNTHRPAHRMIVLPNMLGSQFFLTRIPVLADHIPHLHMYVHAVHHSVHLTGVSHESCDPRLIRPATVAPEPAVPIHARHADLRVVRQLSCPNSSCPTSSVLPHCTRPALQCWATPCRARRQLHPSGHTERASCTTTRGAVSRSADGILVLAGALICSCTYAGSYWGRRRMRARVSKGLQLRSTPFWCHVYCAGVLPCALRTLGCGTDLRRLLLTVNQAPRVGSSVQDKLFVIFV